MTIPPGALTQDVSREQGEGLGMPAQFCQVVPHVADLNVPERLEPGAVWIPAISGDLDVRVRVVLPVDRRPHCRIDAGADPIREPEPPLDKRMEAQRAVSHCPMEIYRGGRYGEQKGRN